MFDSEWFSGDMLYIMSVSDGHTCAPSQLPVIQPNTTESIAGLHTVYLPTWLSEQSNRDATIIHYF